MPTLNNLTIHLTIRNQITAVIKRHDAIIGNASGPLDHQFLDELEDETLHLIGEALGSKRSENCYLPTLDSLVKKYLG